MNKSAKKTDENQKNCLPNSNRYGNISFVVRLYSVKMTGSMVKWLRHRPFTAVTGVQIPLESLNLQKELGGDLNPCEISLYSFGVTKYFCSITF